MNIIQATALTYHLQLPFSILAQKHFQMLVERGYGDLDHSALVLTVGHVDE